MIIMLEQLKVRCARSIKCQKRFLVDILENTVRRRLDDAGLGPLYRVEGIMDQYVYNSILENRMLPFIDK